MARIRTIKPEFWTDEKIVRLPFVARLLFIGLWNFADDTGALDYSPERIKLQVLPAEQDCDIHGLIDLLVAADLVEYWATADGTKAISIRTWSDHQKIDNPSRKTIIREDYRKKNIPSETRVAVAKKYACPPGGEVAANCYYCGMPGTVKWWLGSNGKPTRWITLSELEFDHFVSEHSGGESTGDNIVLACRACNRGKREFDPHQFFAIKNPTGEIDSPSEPSPLEGKGSRKRTKDQGPTPASRAEVVDLPDWLPSSEWEAYVEMRQRIRAPMTPAAKVLEIRELTKLRADGDDPTAVLEQSIRKSWRGLFPIKAAQANRATAKILSITEDERGAA